MINLKNSTISFGNFFLILFFVFILFVQSCIIGDHRPRWVAIDPILSNRSLTFENIHKVINNDKRFRGDTYLVFGVLLYELNSKTGDSRTLWKLDCGFKDVYANIPGLPPLPKKIKYGEKIERLNEVVAPSDFRITTEFEYRLIINVIGVDYQGNLRRSFEILSIIKNDEVVEIEP